MKIYEIIGVRLNCEGWPIGEERVGLFTNPVKAEQFVQIWPVRWDRNDGDIGYCFRRNVRLQVVETDD